MARLDGHGFHGLLRHLSRCGDLGVHERSLSDARSRPRAGDWDIDSMDHECVDIRNISGARKEIERNAVLLLRGDLS